MKHYKQTDKSIYPNGSQVGYIGHEEQINTIQ